METEAAAGKITEEKDVSEERGREERGMSLRNM